MANQRSSNSRLLAIGVAVLVVGVLLVLVIVRNADDEPADPAPVATEQQDADGPTEQETPLTPQQLSTARLPLPLEVPEGTEALAMRMTFVRSVAAIPSPGDRVNVYRYLAATDGEAPAPDDTEVDAPTTPGVTSSLPDPGPDSELVLTESEVLAVTGPLPAANGGELTMVLAVPPGDVPGLMPLADDSQLWFTLLPGVEEATDEPTDAATDGTEEPA